jgi:DNA-binding transcriptional LysR family regulator
MRNHFRGLDVVRCRHPLWRKARSGHDRGADQAAQAALRYGSVAFILDAHGRPAHPRDLLDQACLRRRFASGATPTWEFGRDGGVLRVDPAGPLTVRLGAAVDLAVDAAVTGLGIVHLFEGWLRPYLDSGALEPVLELWWQSFSGPFLYFPGRRHLPAPLRAFVDFIKS